MALKQDGANIFLCPKQGIKIEGVVVKGVSILGVFFCPKQGQGSFLQNFITCRICLLPRHLFYTQIKFSITR